MIIETTINFNGQRFDAISILLEDSSVDMQTLIKRCLKLLAPNIRKLGFQFEARRYQEVTYMYSPVHFSMSEAEYDLYADLQKVSRCCFSLLVAIALDMYAKKVLSQKISDSYQDVPYYKVYLVYKNYPMYIFWWDEEVRGDEKPHLRIE